jgi:hypothetical protein
LRSNMHVPPPENKPLPWLAGLPCVRLARDMTEAVSAVFRTSLAYGRPAGNGGRTRGHTADLWTRGKANEAHDKPSAHGREPRRHTA